MTPIHLILTVALMWSGGVCAFIVVGIQQDMNCWDKRSWLWWEKAAPVVFVVSFLGMMAA